MKVILKADVKGTGKKGDIIEVSDGFAKNYLFKKGLAELATAGGINEIAQQRSSEAYHRAELIKSYKMLAENLKGKEVEVPIRAGANGKLFGAVTTADIASALSKAGYDVDKKKISIKEPIKNLGVFEAEVRLMEGISTTIKVNVVAL